jgi:hypothetical protein
MHAPPTSPLPRGSDDAATSGVREAQGRSPHRATGVTPDAKRRVSRRRAEQTRVIDALRRGELRPLDHFALGLPAGDEEVKALLADDAAELRRLLDEHEFVASAVSTAERCDAHSIILERPRVPVSRRRRAASGTSIGGIELARARAAVPPRITTGPSPAGPASSSRTSTGPARPRALTAFFM